MPTIYKPRKPHQPKADNYYDIERRKVYNSERWHRLRSWKFSCNPLCEMCLKENKTTPAEDIHHITPFMSTDDPVQRYYLAYDFNNLMSLCKKCHQAIHNNRKGSS